MTIKLNKDWKFSLAKERNVTGRRPHFFDDSVLHSFHYDKHGFCESALLSIDLASGLENWRFTEPHVLNEPSVNQQGSIFISSFSGAVCSFDRNGQLRWRKQLTDCNIWKTVLLGEDRLIVAEIAGQSKNTWCLSQDSGEIIWKFENGGHSYPVVMNDQIAIHVSVQDGKAFSESIVRVFAIEISSGKALWFADSPEYLFVPHIFGDVVFIGGRGSVRAYKIHDGKLLARYDVGIDDTIDGCFSHIGEQLIFAAEESNVLHSVQLVENRGILQTDYSFKKRWSLPLDSRPEGLIGLIGGKHFVALSNGSLAFFCPENGLLSEVVSIGCASPFFSANGNKLVMSKGRELSLFTHESHIAS